MRVSRSIHENTRKFLKSFIGLSKQEIEAFELNSNEKVRKKIVRVLTEKIKSTTKRSLYEVADYEFALHLCDRFMDFLGDEHFVLGDVDNFDYKCTRYNFLDDVATSISVEFKYKGVTYLAYYSYMYPFDVKERKINKDTYVLTIQLHKVIVTNDRNNKEIYPVITFMPHPNKEKQSMIVSPLSKTCASCGCCRFVNDTNQVRQNTYDMSTYTRCSKCVFPVPLDTVYAIGEYVVRCFNDRETIYYKNYKHRDTYSKHNVHHVNVNDKDRTVNLKEFKYVYKESEKYFWKGGHHASPAEHDVRGYYRKSNCGDYIRDDAGNFTKVDKGKGDFTYVKGFHRGTKKNNVTFYKVEN